MSKTRIHALSACLLLWIGVSMLCAAGSARPNVVVMIADNKEIARSEVLQQLTKKLESR